MDLSQFQYLFSYSIKDPYAQIDPYGHGGVWVTDFQQGAKDAAVNSGYGVGVEPSTFVALGLYPIRPNPNSANVAANYLSVDDVTPLSDEYGDNLYVNSAYGAKAFVDAGVENIWMETSDCMCYCWSGIYDYGMPSDLQPTPTAPYEWYEIFRPCFDAWIEVLGSHFKGFMYEATFDNGAAWLHDYAQEHGLWINWDMVESSPFGKFAFNSDDHATRMTQVDSVGYDYFAMDIDWHLPRMLAVRDDYSDVQIGINPGVRYATDTPRWLITTNTGCSGPLDQAHGPVFTHTSVQPDTWFMQQYARVLGGIKEEFGKVDFIQIYVPPPVNGPPSDWMSTVVNFFDGLHLTEASHHAKEIKGIYMEE